MKKITLTLAASFLGLASSICFAQYSNKIAVYPWDFKDGNVTSREMVLETVRKIAEHSGYTVLPHEAVKRKFNSLVPAVALRKGLPIKSDLARFAAAVHANIIIFGNTNWHTRSIWVGAGPKTISTASVDVYVYDDRTRSVTFQKRGVEGRSDEKEQALKVVLSVLVTPLVTTVSGGPATPREQRAVQIALGRALEPWTRLRQRQR